MTEDLAREIKNEIQVFQHSTDIATFRLTFNTFCDEMFTAYGVYDVNTDLQERDYTCIYLAYTYVMIQSTAKSVMTSMINKLESSGSSYLTDLNAGFLAVQEYQLDVDKTWLWSLFEDKGAFICAAFRYDSSMWTETDEKDYALMYIGAIDPDLKTYIEEYDCSGESAAGKVSSKNQLPLSNLESNFRRQCASHNIS